MSQKQIDERRMARRLQRRKEEAERLRKEAEQRRLEEERLERVEGFKPIAVRDDRLGNTVISYNTGTREFVLTVSGKFAGPFTLGELKALKENLNDVIDMKGRYLFIKEYDQYGQRTE